MKTFFNNSQQAAKKRRLAEVQDDGPGISLSSVEAQAPALPAVPEFEDGEVGRNPIKDVRYLSGYNIYQKELKDNGVLKNRMCTTLSSG